MRCAVRRRFWVEVRDDLIYVFKGLFLLIVVWRIIFREKGKKEGG